MAIIQSIMSKLGYIPVEKIAGPNMVLADATFKSLSSVMSQISGEVSQAYAQSVWVYASISAISQNISNVPLKITTEVKDKEPITIESGPEYELFNQPNPLMNGKQLIEATMIYMGLRGEAFWILEDREDVTKLPTRIWCFDPIRFMPILDQISGMVIGWRYTGKVGAIDFGLHEIIHFKYFNPYNDVRGLAPLQAAKTSIDQDYYSGQFNKTFFQEGAAVGGYITVPGELSDTQYNRLQKQFDNRHKGYNKAHRVGIIEGGADYKEAKLTQRDMDFVQMKKLSREEIFAVYKVNSVVMGLYEDIKSFEGIKTAHKTFWTECLVPKTTYLEEQIWSRLFSSINGGKVWVKFDLSTVSALQEDFEKKVDIGEKLQKMGWPINAINKRLELGMEDVSWGDVWYAPINLVPIASVEATPKEPAKSIDSLTKSFDDLENLVKIAEDAERERVWKSYLTSQGPVERLFKAKIEKYFFDQRKRVLGKVNLQFSKGVSDGIFDPAEEAKMLENIMKPIYELSIKTGFLIAIDELGLSGVQFVPLDPDYLGAMSMKLTNIPAQIVGTIKKQLDEAITAGIAAGESVVEISDRVRHVYNMAHSRALTIARTEAGSAISHGKFLTMKKNGVKKHKWITALDEEVRDSHSSLHGKVALIGDKFPGSSLKYQGDSSAPAKEVINCRCTTISVKET